MKILVKRPTYDEVMEILDPIHQASVRLFVRNACLIAFSMGSLFCGVVIFAITF